MLIKLNSKEVSCHDPGVLTLVSDDFITVKCLILQKEIMFSSLQNFYHSFKSRSFFIFVADVMIVTYFHQMIVR